MSARRCLPQRKGGIRQLLRTQATSVRHTDEVHVQAAKKIGEAIAGYATPRDPDGVLHDCFSLPPLGDHRNVLVQLLRTSFNHVQKRWQRRPPRSKPVATRTRSAGRPPECMTPPLRPA